MDIRQIMLCQDQTKIIRIETTSIVTSKTMLGTKMQRITWIDNAKAILIFLVVLGHFHYVYGPIYGKSIIYAFHVPAFLFITGFLLPNDFRFIGIQGLLRRWIGPYLRAYVFFSLIAITIWWVGSIVAHRSLISPLPAVWGSFYGVAGQKNGLVHQNQPLWYFPYLVSSMIGTWLAVYISSRLGTIFGWVVILAYASVAFLYHGPRLPWDIEIAGTGSAMIFFGYQFRQHYESLASFVEAPRAAIATSIVTILLLVGISILNGPTNINGAEFGKNGLLFLLAALSGSVATMSLAAQIPATRLARSISFNTLTIFALHIYLVRVASALPQPSDEIAKQIAIWFSAAAIVLLCLPIALLLQPVLRRWVFFHS
ncbi:acyltransferase family protein [Tabrizicola sp. J26]|uniref:acyltransferase family protein n=1 Tax=Alitabrizicola rongguiensis TaxID=2909234 RepID=UPI001F1C7E48|nr:acyltransferase family protein [Tabrizicola rongguiensis]MCF1711075.1 acyltransferase family protein [Tabrizicola rongguiensis]